MYRSLLTAWHQSSGAVWESCLDSEVVAHYGESEDSLTDSPKDLALIDLSPLPRVGIKGSEPERWLQPQGYTIDEALNKAYQQEDGSLICRLSTNELLWLSRLHSPTRVVEISQPDGRCYPLARQDSHVEFIIVGRSSANMMAKLCGVDLTPQVFENLRVVQTSVARLSAIIVRADIAAYPGYRILVDSASARYFWQCLLDAMAEYDGKVVGFRALAQTI